jgi:hypothetical protein
MQSDSSEQQSAEARSRRALELWENQYFQEVLGRVQGAYQEAILALSPSQVAEFRDYQTCRQLIDVIRMNIQADMMGGEYDDQGEVLV